jgi:hypothetical protein
MTHSLTIHSPFNDLSELVEGLSPFYTGEHLVVRAPADVPEGDWIRFEILLTDGTPGLTGLGRHAGTNDNGEDFGAERFDVYLGELQVDEGRSDVIWERIVLAYQQAQGTDRPTGEVDISALEAQLSAPSPEPVGDDTAAEHEQAGLADFESDAATVAAPISEFPGASVDDAVTAQAGEDDDFADSFDAPSEALTPPPVAAPAPPRAAARPAAPPVPAAAPPAPPRSGALLRPSLPPSWAPAAEAPSGGASNGLFAYGDSGLPVPARPPRPDGEERRIEPAPRPQA